MLLDEYMLLVIETKFYNETEEKLQEMLDRHLKMGEFRTKKQTTGPSLSDLTLLINILNYRFPVKNECLNVFFLIRRRS